MNLYFKSLFGGLQSTEKFEARQHQLVEDYKRYLEIESSQDLAEYQALSEKVKSAEFKEIKRTLLNRKYKDTEEYRDMAKYNKLENKASLQLYFEVLESEELAEYLAFKETPEFANLSDKKAVKASEELQKLKKFERSKECKAYNRFHDSYIEKEYLELKEKVNQPEFIKNNEFWSNPNRWETTEEFQTESRYKFLDEDANIRFYYEHSREEFAEVEGLELVAEEKFEWNKLETSKWKPGFYYKNPNLKSEHSFADEKQANNHGKNVEVKEGRLHILTKEENNESTAWNREKGFVTTEFDYTSDVLNGKEFFNGKYGIFTAKMNFNGSKHVSHALSMRSGEMLPHIDICKCENGAIEQGLYVGTLENLESATKKVTGLNIHRSLVYTLKWAEEEMVWYINNLEILRTPNYISKEDMSPMINSFIKGKRGGEADFEIEYIRVYKKN